MEFNEALRRTIGGHWRLLVAFIVLPLIAVGALHFGTERSYEATGRVQASSTLPGTVTEADAVLNRVKGIATSSSIINQSLKQVEHPNRSAAEVAQDKITVRRLGSSAVFNLTVTDRDPKTAAQFSAALVTQLVAFLNGSGPAQKALVTQLTDREDKLVSQRVDVAAKLAVTTSPVENARLSAQLRSLDQQITDTQTSLRTAQTGDITAAVLSTPSQARLAPSQLDTDLALAALAGLIGGLLVAALLEVIRPHVPDARAFAREVEAPMLGTLSVRQAKGSPPRLLAEGEVLVALRRAVARRNIDTVALVGPGSPERLARLAAELETSLAPAGARPVPHVASPPDGRTPNTRNADSDSGSPRARTLAPMLESPPHRSATTLNVRALSDVDDISDGRRYGLVLLVPRQTLHREVRRVRDLIATTGWPVIGVLGDPVRGRRRTS